MSKISQGPKCTSQVWKCAVIGLCSLPLNLADVSGTGTCVETLTMTAWDAMGEHETDSLNLDLIEILKTSYLSILGTAALI